jgi:AraC-like DNA-binding protein
MNIADGSSFVSRMEALLGSLSALVGVQAIWKDGDIEAGPPYSADSCMHRCPYCLAVKEHPDRLARCRLEDGRHALMLRTEQSDGGRGAAPLEPGKPSPGIRAASNAGHGKVGFFRTCHAGGTDYIYPVRTRFRYLGAFFFGPWRAAARSPYADIAQGIYLRIPRLNPETGAILEGLLQPLAVWVAGRRIEPEPGAGDALNVRRMRLVLDMIARRYTQGFSAAEGAELCGLSVSRFLHAFREETGSSFSAHLRSLRLGKAKELLESTDLPIVSIAEAAGFSGRALFNRIFLRDIGTAPREYRRLSRNP